jgi:flagellar protein FlgJ
MINKINNIDLLSASNKIKDRKLSKNEDKLKEVSEEFEAIFIKILLDSMDKTVDRESDMFYGGNSEDIFRSMLNTERSKSMAKSSNLGIADSLYNQLSRTVKTDVNKNDK